MASNALQNQKDSSFCDVHRLSNSEKESMERASHEIHATFEALHADREPLFKFRERSLSTVD